MSCQSKRHHSLDRINILAGIFVVLAATVANAGAPPGLPPAHAQERAPRPHLLDLSAPQMRSMSEHSRPLRLDQVRASSATANEATPQLTQTDFDVEFRPKSAFVIQWQTKPELERIARNFRRNGLPVVTLWHSGPGLVALGLSPRGVPGLYFTQGARD
jgi:hypothetical protein